jgi:hypothetical protein
MLSTSIFEVRRVGKQAHVESDVLTFSHSCCLDCPPLEFPACELPRAVVHRKRSTKVGQPHLDILENIDLVIRACQAWIESYCPRARRRETRRSPTCDAGPSQPRRRSFQLFTHQISKPFSGDR